MWTNTKGRTVVIQHQFNLEIYVSHLKMNPGPFRTLLPDTSTTYSVLCHDTDSVSGNHVGDLPSPMSPGDSEGNWENV